MGVSTQRGRLGNAVGTTVLDEVQGTGEMTITLDSHSLSTGSELMEKMLKGSSWFAVDEHPAVTFRATSISFFCTEADSHRRGVDAARRDSLHEPVCNVLRLREVAVWRALHLRHGRTRVIECSCFEMASLPTFIGDEVKLLIQAEAVQQDPTPMEPRP